MTKLTPTPPLTPAEVLWQQTQAQQNPTTFAGLPPTRIHDAIRVILESLVHDLKSNKG